MATKCNLLFSARLVPGPKHKQTCLLLIYKLLHSNGVRKLPKHWKYLTSYPTMAAILYLHNQQQSKRLVLSDMTDNEIYQRTRFTRLGLGNGRAVRND